MGFEEDRSANLALCVICAIWNACSLNCRRRRDIVIIDIHEAAGVAK
jgi:hypothetical protein